MLQIINNQGADNLTVIRNYFTFTQLMKSHKLNRERAGKDRDLAELPSTATTAVESDWHYLLKPKFYPTAYLLDNVPYIFVCMYKRHIKGSLCQQD